MGESMEQMRQEIELLRRRLDKERHELEAVESRLAALESILRKEAESPPVSPVLPEVPVEIHVPAAPVFTPPPIPSPAVFSGPPVIPAPAAEEKVRETPPPLPSLAERAGSFELRLGTYWLVRIGVVMLLVAMAFAANYAYENIVTRMGPGVKVALLYVVGAGLAGAGLFLEKRGEALRNYGRVLFGGGLAAVYYVTYAAHFVPRLQIVESPIVAGILLLIWAGVMTAAAEWRRSQSLAVLSVILAYITSAITPVETFTLYSNLVLAVVVVFLFTRHRWQLVPAVGLAGTYAGFGFWRVTGLIERDGFSASEPWWILLGCLAIYWVTFTAAVLAPAGRGEKPWKAALFFTANNLAFFLYGCLLLPRDGVILHWHFELACALVLLGLAGFVRRVFPDSLLLARACFAEGLILLTVAWLTWLEGGSLALMLGLQVVALMTASVKTQSTVARIGSWITAFLAVTVECDLLTGSDPGLLTMIVVGAVPVLCGWMTRVLRGTVPTTAVEAESLLLASGGVLVWGLGTAALAPDGSLGWMFMLEAIALTLVAEGIRFPGLALPSQGLAIGGFVFWLANRQMPGETVQTVGGLVLVAGALFLSHWWNRRRDQPGVAAFEVFYAVGLCAVIMRWLAPHLGVEGEILAFLAVGLGLMFYAFKTRLYFLALAVQSFVLLALVHTLDLPVHGFVPGFVALLPVLVVLALSLFVRLALLPIDRKPGGHPAVSLAGRIYGLAAGIMGLVWIARHVPDWGQPVVWGLVGLALLALARGIPSVLSGWFAAAYSLAGLLAFLFHYEEGAAALGCGLIFLGLMAVAERLLGSPRQAGAILVVFGICGLVWTTRATVFWWDPSLLTLTWSVFAALILGTGFLFRHTGWRWLGLGLFGVALLRLGFVDLWRFGTLVRIVTLFAISLLAIGLGFLYSRYQEKLGASKAPPPL